MDWDQLLGKEADDIGLSNEQRAAFLARFATQNREAQDAKLAADLNISESAFKKRMGDVYEQFGRRYPELNQATRGKREKLRSLLQQKFEQSKQQNQFGHSGDGSQSIENWQKQQGIIANDQAKVEIGKVDQTMGDRVEQTHSGSGDNVARDKHVHVYQSAPPPKPTGDGPTTNLQDRGVARDRFFGRDDVLAELHQLLQTGEHRVAIASVDGMGGVGKTELAVQYAREHLHETYRGGVVWLAGERSLSKLLEFAQAQLFAGRIRLADLGNEKVQLQYCWRNWPAQEKPPESVLLIFDDVTNYQSQVAAILPGDSRFRVLITTREKFQGIERLELQVLTPGAALQLLESIVGAERIAAERETAQALCEWLGFLPLGIELAGYYIVEEDCDLSELLQELEVRKRKLKHPALKTPEPTMTAQLGVEAAFELSWERLDLDARFIGAYLSLFAAAPIPWELVVSREEVSPEAYEAISTARRKLVRFSLLQKVGKLFQYHPLIKHFFSEKLEADAFIIPPSHQLTGATTEIRRLVGLEDE